MTYPIPIIYDGDPGHDDAIAMLLAHASEKIDVLAVTTCCGNQTIEKTTYNAQRVCTLIGLDVPIGMGQSHPLFSKPITAPNIHGQSGLDGPKLPEPKVALSPLRAVELMAKTLRECERPVTIVSTGPLTNTAALLLTHPELKNKIECISLMGGGIELGNWTPAAEFNILVDPEAADIVFSSGIPIIMAGLDVTEKALIYEEDFDRIRSIGGNLARTVAEWLDYFYQFHRSIGYPGAPLHDPCAVAYLIAPELFETEDLYVVIDKDGEFTRGATVGDRNRVRAAVPNAKCLMNIDRQGFVDLLTESVRRLSHG